jgi:acyl dehydratase
MLMPHAFARVEIAGNNGHNRASFRLFSPDMTTLTFEDFKPGRFGTFGPRLVTREEILEFAGEFDPQPMHLDEEAARSTMLGGLGASGWHTCCIMMKMIADNLLLDAASMGAPGIDEVKWLKPVRPDDNLTVRGSVLTARVSESRPDRGFVSFLWEIHNDRGEKVMTLICPQMIERRRAAVPA